MTESRMKMGRLRNAIVLALAMMCISACGQATNAAAALGSEFIWNEDEDPIAPVAPNMSVMLFQGEQLTSDQHCVEIKITNTVEVDRPPLDYFLGNYSRYGDFYNDERNTHQIRGTMVVEQVDENGDMQISEQPFDLGIDDNNDPNGTAIATSPYVAINGNFTFVIYETQIDVIERTSDEQPLLVTHSWGTTGQVAVDVENRSLRRSRLPGERIEFVCGYRYKIYLLFENEIPRSPNDPFYDELTELQNAGVELAAW